MTKILILKETMAMLPQETVDELMLKGQVKLDSKEQPYLSIDIDKYLEDDFEETETDAIQE
jgi:hypothetical protein